jgi:1-aminocyclopropane-1-carboxylate deaminase
LPHQKVLFPALKETFKDEIRTFVTEILDEKWELITEYHFGGYGVTQDLVAFINEFYEKIKFL